MKDVPYVSLFFDVILLCCCGLTILFDTDVCCSYLDVRCLQLNTTVLRELIIEKKIEKQKEYAGSSDPQLCGTTENARDVSRCQKNCKSNNGDANLDTDLCTK